MAGRYSRRHQNLQNEFLFCIQTQRTTTVREIEIDLENIGSDEYESGFGYFKNIREFFKRLFDDAKKFFKKVIGFDIIKAIKQFFNGKIDD